jgi:tellurite resistance protein
MEADPLSPEERHLFNEVTGVIPEELFARITVKDRLETAEDAERVAVLIADGVWYRFEISERNR